MAAAASRRIVSIGRPIGTATRGGWRSLGLPVPWPTIEPVLFPTGIGRLAARRPGRKRAEPVELRVDTNLEGDFTYKWSVAGGEADLEDDESRKVTIIPLSLGEVILRVSVDDEEQSLRTSENFTLNVEQSYGNCPQYIHERNWRQEVPDAAPSSRHHDALDGRLRGWIEGADTFFIASGYRGEGESPTFGMDASHRGGQPGFVRVEDERHLVFLGERETHADSPCK